MLYSVNALPFPGPRWRALLGCGHTCFVLATEPVDAPDACALLPLPPRYGGARRLWCQICDEWPVIAGAIRIPANRSAAP